MSVDGLITVYRTDTGEKVRIPPHWMDNPELAAPFQRTPSSRARAAATQDATGVSTDTDTTAPGAVPDLDTSTTARATRPRRSSTVQSDTETPAAGAKE